MEVVRTAEGRIARFGEVGAVTETPEIAVSRAESDVVSPTSRERAMTRPSGDISKGPQHVQRAAGRRALACCASFSCCISTSQFDLITGFGLKSGDFANGDSFTFIAQGKTTELSEVCKLFHAHRLGKSEAHVPETPTLHELRLTFLRLSSLRIDFRNEFRNLDFLRGGVNVDDGLVALREDRVVFEQLKQRKLTLDLFPFFFV